MWLTPMALMALSACGVKSANLPTPFCSSVPQGVLVVLVLPNKRVKTWYTTILLSLLLVADACVSADITGSGALLQASNTALARLSISIKDFLHINLPCLVFLVA